MYKVAKTLDIIPTTKPKKILINRKNSKGKYTELPKVKIRTKTTIINEGLRYMKKKDGLSYRVEAYLQR